MRNRSVFAGLFVVAALVFFVGVAGAQEAEDQQMEGPWLFAGVAFQSVQSQPMLFSPDEDGSFETYRTNDMAYLGAFIESAWAPHFSAGLFLLAPLTSVNGSGGTDNVDDYTYEISGATIGVQGKAFARSNHLGPFLGASVLAFMAGADTTSTNNALEDFEKQVQTRVGYSTLTVDLGSRFYIGNPNFIIDIYGSYSPQIETFALGFSAGIAVGRNTPKHY